MGMSDKYGNQMGSASQDLHWKKMLPGYQGQHASFAVPGYHNPHIGPMTPNWGPDLGQELRGPDNWMGSALGDRHLMHSMTEGLSDRDAQRVAALIDSGQLDHLGYAKGRQTAYEKLRNWNKPKPAEEESIAPESPRISGPGVPPSPRPGPSPRPRGPVPFYPWSPYP